MTDDLVKRLRHHGTYGLRAQDLMGEAADRIETLSAARTDLCERIEALEDALREIVDRRCYGTEDCRNIARCALEAKP